MHFRQKDTAEILTLPMSYTALAQYLSVDRSAMTRELKSLEEEEILEKKGKQIILLSFQKITGKLCVHSGTAFEDALIYRIVIIVIPGSESKFFILASDKTEDTGDFFPYSMRSPH